VLKNKTCPAKFALFVSAPLPGEKNGKRTGLKFGIAVKDAAVRKLILTNINKGKVLHAGPRAA